MNCKNGEVIFTRTERIEYRFNYTLTNIVAKAKYNRAFDLLAPKEKLAVIKMLLPKGEKEENDTRYQIEILESIGHVATVHYLIVKYFYMDKG